MSKVHRYFYTEKEPVKLGKDNVIEGIEIFKTGEWRGVKYAKKDIDKIVDNFNHLKKTGLFADVPVRLDHDRSAGNLVGYITKIWRQGFRLLADLEITEEEVYEKWERTTLRGRSVEIGPYEANDGEVYEPVLWGLAWVDIPQIDNLKPRMAACKDAEIVDLNRDEILNQFKQEEEVKEKLEQLQKENKELQTKLEAATKNQKIEVFKFEHDGKVFEFANEETKKSFEELVKSEGKLNGKVEVLEKHVGELKEFQLKIKENERIAFVEKLKDDGKITPATLDKDKKFVLGLSDEQYKNYVELKNDQPAIIQLGASHGDQSQTGDESELETLKETLVNLQQAGDKEGAKAVEEKIAKLQKEGK